MHYNLFLDFSWTNYVGVVLKRILGLILINVHGNVQSSLSTGPLQIKKLEIINKFIFTTIQAFQKN